MLLKQKDELLLCACDINRLSSNNRNTITCFNIRKFTPILYYNVEQIFEYRAGCPVANGRSSIARGLNGYT